MKKMVMEGRMVCIEQEAGFAAPCFEIGGELLENEIEKFYYKNGKKKKYRITVEVVNGSSIS